VTVTVVVPGGAGVTLVVVTISPRENQGGIRDTRLGMDSRAVRNYTWWQWGQDEA
jgi:hypothetical protein